MKKRKKRIFEIIQIGNREDVLSHGFDWVIVTVILVNIIVMFLEMTALKNTATATVSFLENTAIVIVPLMSAILLRHRPGFRLICSACMALTGVAFLTIFSVRTSLSGGESQRMKLAAELFRKATGNTLYILDEPTTGLHFEDIKVLLGVLQQLVDQGNTILIIEHNLDVLKSVDYLFDLGPEGGAAGGRIVAQGTPEQLAADPRSVTGPYLKEVLNR